MEANILEVNNNGLEISLMDGSRWQIDAGDISKTVCWYPTQRIKIEKKHDGNYVLVNLDTATPDKVRASRF